MKKTIFLLICSICALAASGQSYRPLWDGSHPMPGDNRITGPETTAEGHVSNITDPGIYVYLPADSVRRGKKTPAVVICPGGGYGIVAIELEGHAYARFLSANGIAGIVLKYRLPNGVHNVPGDDARRALQIVRDSARRWNINPHQVGISGFSAGGHLAASVAAHPGRPKNAPAFQILFYPVITFADSTVRHDGSRWSLTRGDTQLDNYYSPERNVTHQTPPTLIFVSDDDTGVLPVNSYMLHDSLRSHNIPARTVNFPKGGHGWGFHETFDHLPEVKREILEFIHR